MRTSDKIDEIAGALAKAQGEFPDIPKDKTAKIQSPKGNYEYRYADLATIIKATKSILSKNGLALHQPVETHGECGRVVTLLVHSSGQFFETTFEFDEGMRMQETGAAITYVRRYCLTGMLGITADDDTDADEIPGRRPKAPAHPPSRPIAPVSGPAPKVISPASAPSQSPHHPTADQLTRLYTLCSAYEVSPATMKSFILSKYGHASSKDLSIVQYEEVCAFIEAGYFSKKETPAEQGPPPWEGGGGPE